MSSFQARTATDVVFVKYEGCNLTVIDSCSDDSVRGALGSYKPVDWTGGAVEKVDIGNGYTWTRYTEPRQYVTTATVAF